jgi:predicted AlkP superfamily phosphohydrolase/phosphomutase
MTPTFLLGIDGGTWRVLEDLSLPAFERLRSDATTGTLRSSLPPTTFPAWKCLSTGKNPGKLGVFGFANFDRHRRENRTNDATHFDSAELWDYLSASGSRVGVVNVPSTYPPHPVNGIMVGGPNSGRDGYVSPPDRESEVESYGYRPLTSGDRLGLKAGGDRTVSTARRLIDARFDVTESLLSGGNFDLFALGIFCTDTVQHYYWNEREVEATYERIDRRLDRLRRHLDGWNVVVVSDHGFQPIEGAVYLDSWLEREGFLSRRARGRDGGRSVRHSLGLTSENALGVIRGLRLERLVDRLPESLVTGIADALASDAPPVVDTVDWERSRAVFLHGGIYALDDDPGRRAETADAVAEALESFTDASGDPVVDEVWRTRDVYTGAHAGAAPELIPVSNTHKFLGFGPSGDLFTRDEWAASHEMDGVFLASGPSFGTGTGVELDLQDVVPTLLHAMGDAIPADVDGETRRDLLAEGTGPATEEPSVRDPIDPPHRAELPGDEQDRIEERLRDLGYVE